MKSLPRSCSVSLKKSLFDNRLLLWLLNAKWKCSPDDPIPLLQNKTKNFWNLLLTFPWTSLFLMTKSICINHFGMPIATEKKGYRSEGINSYSKVLQRIFFKSFHAATNSYSKRSFTIYILRHLVKSIPSYGNTRFPTS